jgi:hypothetical protein
MPTYEDYAFAQRHYRETEMHKKPGQDFCDKYGWRLHSDFDEIQRPDKITYMNGSIYRTHTPTTHVWYQSKKNPSHHIWIEFSGALIFVKIGIRVIKKPGSSWNTTLLEPEPSYFRDYRTFSDGIRAVEYILGKNM